jgi:hypothetical protein
MFRFQVSGTSIRRQGLEGHATIVTTSTVSTLVITHALLYLALLATSIAS